MLRECIAPFRGLSALDLGFHIIQDDDYGDTITDMANYALITIKKGEVIARQVEGEFKAQASPTSTWRWYAKNVAENKFQIKFPTTKKMGMVPGVSFKVEQWNHCDGAKAELATAWFRIFGIPSEKMTEKRACYVGSLVRIPLEVDKINLKRWEYVRVKIACKHITKVLAIVEGLLDMHFYDVTFQRKYLLKNRLILHGTLGQGQLTKKMRIIHP
uniref:DUF4283 domain-containing protein n=1 Tax=Setaria viridis TaxID=4556 RepID=A0A4U6V361_SETVI|nr:hypothetical protein SEVIR_4G232600v2 [Setaria viridis]